MLEENCGWRVATFADAESALAALPQAKVAVIVTDFSMPRVDGFEFIRRAAPIVPEVPFIMISGHTIHLPDHDFGGLENLRTILPKPFGWRKLADEIVLHVPELAASVPPPAPTSA